MSISEAVAEVQRHQQYKHDFIVPTKKMVAFHDLNENKTKLTIDVPQGGNPVIDLELTDHGLQQFGTWGHVPVNYLRRLQGEDPKFMADVMNREILNTDDARMIRTYSDDGRGTMRAWLSRSYGRFGPEQLLQPLIGMFHQNPDKWKILECSITEHGFIMNAVMPTTLFDIRVGDPVAFGIRAYTGETGKYATGIDVLVHRLVCTNSMTTPDKLTGIGYRKIHKGSQQPLRMFEMSQETLDAEARYTQLQLRDTVQGMLRGGAFQRAVDQMRLMASSEVEDPIAATELLSKDAGLSEAESKKLKNSMMKSGDSTMWGLQNALTDMARDLEDYDRKRDLEAFAGNMLTASPKKYMNAKE